MKIKEDNILTWQSFCVFQETFPELPVEFWPDRPSHAEAVWRSDQEPAGCRGSGLRLPVQRGQLGAGGGVHLRGPGPPPVAGGARAGMVQTPHITLLQARHPSIQGTTMKTILQNLPLPEGDKLQLSNSLNELKTPLLQDKTVFILTFLLGKIFHKIFFQTKAEPRAELSSRFIRLWKQCQCLYAYVNQSVQMLFLCKSKKYYMLRPLFKYYKDILFQLFWTWRTIARCGGWGTG